MFHDAGFWNKQTAAEKEAWQGHTDWLCEYPLLQPLIKHHAEKPRSAALFVGSGTSTFPEQLYDGGVREVLVVDASTEVVSQLTRRNEVGSRSGLTFKALDIGAADALPKLMPGGRPPYDIVIDKGTVDCLLCEREGGHKRAETAIRTMYEVLKTPAVLVLVSHSPPSDRLDLLQTVYWHDIQVKVVRPIPMHDLTQPDMPERKLEDLPEAPAGATPFEPGTAYVYVLTK
mmetsp:Transcript_22625/g.57564  ORF Transcript_22625/g.57564 Transcript_22625/m.57564 type:complete len:230 (-) Transcript_22625:284-973(-)|eukprot:CAMPEP_0202880914 /NCGR_PEP_ID=MMETSP1391-20130828/35737_1 /ASSEMBLY_ACC=CAM_ASM_000867 /TAXON_ID=1034604 /ORGANISM="Chlamydomonas leiostraca, Strain SAG 11-49" /LENGTH=229 /DNA_ID=CAMNT_0049563489 /DNA_START=93 /DNA_END=782 /DNA_ORIENTATION=-